MTFIQQAVVLEWLEYGIYYSKVLIGNFLATSCADVIKIGPTTPEITRVTTAPFWRRGQKSAYNTECFGNYYVDLHQLFNIGRHMHDDCKTT